MNIINQNPQVQQNIGNNQFQQFPQIPVNQQIVGVPQIPNYPINYNHPNPNGQPPIQYVFPQPINENAVINNYVGPDNMIGHAQPVAEGEEQKLPNIHIQNASVFRIIPLTPGKGCINLKILAKIKKKVFPYPCNYFCENGLLKIMKVMNMWMSLFYIQKD